MTSKWNRYDIDYSEDSEIEDNRRFVSNTLDKYKKIKLNKEEDNGRTKKHLARRSK